MGRSRRGAEIRALIFLLLLAACGGGGGVSVSGTITPAPTPRTDLYFGYYGGCPSCALEQQDHTNLYMTRPWGTGGGLWLAETLGQLQMARAGGASVILGLPGAYEPHAEEELSFAWKRITEAGLADHIVALYPIDEPDVAGKTDAEVRTVNAMLRRVFGELPIAVIYGTRGFPAIDTYNWIGRDRYGEGCKEATGLGFQEMKGRLAPWQRIILVPGGADPWRQDPACFASKAHSDAQVVAILAFIWQDNAAPGVGLGIRSNGLRKLYCETGRVIRGMDPKTCI